MYLDSRHFTYQRFFPYEYVVRVLQVLQEKPYKFDPERSIEELILDMKNLGVSYDEIHSTCYKRYGESHQQLSNWNVNDFENVVISGKVYQLNPKDLSCTPHPTISDPSQLVNEDKNILQNYGRPYIDGKPSGSYYKFSKKFEDIEVW